MPQEARSAPSRDAADLPLLRLAALRAPGGAPATLDVMPGEAMSLLGPDAGAVLAMVAGLLRPQSGTVTLSGRTRPRAGARGGGGQRTGMGALIGPPGLLPQRDVAGNVALGGADTAPLLAELDLGGMAHFRADALTAGQALLAALARALAARPALLLLDADLTALDGAARQDFFARITTLRMAHGFAVLHAAAQADDAWALADRAAVLTPTGISAVGTPRDLYARPPDAATARALGPANLLAGIAGEAGSEEVLVSLAAGSTAAVAHPAVGAGAACLVLVRPEEVAVLGGPPPAGTDALPARLVAVRRHAGWNEVALLLDGFEAAGGAIVAHRPALAPLPAIGDACAVAWPPSRALVLPAE